MASKITLFEPHIDGPLFGSKPQVESERASADAVPAKPEGGAESETGCSRATSIGLVALGLVSLLAVALAVRRFRSTSDAVDVAAE